MTIVSPQINQHNVEHVSHLSEAIKLLNGKPSSTMLTVTLAKLSANYTASSVGPLCSSSSGNSMQEELEADDKMILLPSTSRDLAVPQNNLNHTMLKEAARRIKVSEECNAMEVTLEEETIVPWVLFQGNLQDSQESGKKPSFCSSSGSPKNMSGLVSSSSNEKVGTSDSRIFLVRAIKFHQFKRLAMSQNLGQS